MRKQRLEIKGGTFPKRTHPALDVPVPRADVMALHPTSYPCMLLLPRIHQPHPWLQKTPRKISRPPWQRGQPARACPEQGVRAHLWPLGLSCLPAKQAALRCQPTAKWLAPKTLPQIGQDILPLPNWISSLIVSVQHNQCLQALSGTPSCAWHSPAARSRMWNGVSRWEPRCTGGHRARGGHRAHGGHRAQGQKLPAQTAPAAKLG